MGENEENTGSKASGYHQRRSHSKAPLHSSRSGFPTSSNFISEPSTGIDQHPSSALNFVVVDCHRTESIVNLVYEKERGFPTSLEDTNSSSS